MIFHRKGIEAQSNINGPEKIGKSMCQSFGDYKFFCLLISWDDRAGKGDRTAVE
jgi:hypothetical protein